MGYVRELELRYRPGRLLIGPSGPFDAPSKVASALAEMSRIPREVFVVIHLDAKNRPLGYDIASVGCADATMIVPKDVVRPLLYSGAAGCVVAHCHPSGSPQPSPEDIATTKRLRQVLDLCGLMLIDHIIIADDGYFLFREEGPGGA